MKAFFRSWYDFIVGNDWTTVVGVVIAVAVPAFLKHSGMKSAWWLLPLVVATGLTVSLGRAVGKG
jgi:hypothetical protein